MKSHCIQIFKRNFIEQYEKEINQFENRNQYTFAVYKVSYNIHAMPQKWDTAI